MGLCCHDRTPPGKTCLTQQLACYSPYLALGTRPQVPYLAFTPSQLKLLLPATVVPAIHLEAIMELGIKLLELLRGCAFYQWVRGSSLDTR